MNQLSKNSATQESQLNIKDYRSMDSISFQKEIEDYIKQWEAISGKDNFQQQKLIVGSAALRDNSCNSISVDIVIPSTVFGERSETFNWTFKIEGNSDNQQINDFIEFRKKEVDLADVPEGDSITRFLNIYQRKDEIRSVFNSIDKQLHYASQESAIILTALAIYEFEQLSAVRFENYLFAQEMFDLTNFLDKWIACMSVKVEYTKSNMFTMSSVLH